MTKHINSWYAASCDLPSFQQCVGQLNARVVVIGGGFAGVNTALSLSEHNINTILLEAQTIGWGASGRNGGQVIRGFSAPSTALHDRLPPAIAENIEHAGSTSVELVYQRMQQYNIDCDWHFGHCQLALKQRHMDDLAFEYAQLQQDGYPHKYALLDSQSLTKYIDSPRYIGGLVDYGSAHIHPLKLVLGEAIAAQHAGVSIYENSQVIAVDYGKKIQIRTACASITCDAIVWCCNGYWQHGLDNNIAAKVMPACAYNAATQPLSDAQIAQINPQNIAFSDMTVMVDYFRITPDKRLLFGGVCNYSGKVIGDIRTTLSSHMRRVFPYLAATRFEYAWSGQIGIGMNRIPQIGRHLEQPNVYYAQAFSGHGINVTHVAAQVVADAIANINNDIDDWMKIHHHPFPGGHWLRSPLLALGMGYYSLKEFLKR